MTAVQVLSQRITQRKASESSQWSQASKSSESSESSKSSEWSKSSQSPRPSVSSQHDGHYEAPSEQVPRRLRRVRRFGRSRRFRLLGRLRRFRRLRPTALWLLLAGSSPLWAGEILIRNATLETISQGRIEAGSILIRDGRIEAVGPDLSASGDASVFDARGLTVYPGLFDSNTRLGLTEIGAVEMTNDYSEMGEFMPHLLAFDAVHAESEHIPVARVNGITHVLTRPTGGMVPGQGALVNLFGWSPAEMEIRRNGALIIRFPSELSLSSGFSGTSSGERRYSDIRKEYQENRLRLKELLARARHYRDARPLVELEEDRRLAALVPVVSGETVVLIEADSHVDIRNAVLFAEEEKLNYVLLGASDAWKVADFLKEHGTRVILGPRQVLPAREDDPIDILYRTPAILYEKGVPFAISTSDSADVRTLPFEAGNAVAYGLPRQAALRAMTLAPATFLGIADRYGSLEAGKVANLIVADGDILEILTQIRHVFIGGREVPLTSKHRELYETYIARP